MSKGRIHSVARKTRRTTRVKSQPTSKTGGLKFVGLSLSGGKADKACLAVLDYYGEQDRLFVSAVIEKIKTEEFISADLKIHEILLQHSKSTQLIAVDAPLSLPTCLTCKLQCPGFETCQVSQIRWMRDLQNQRNQSKHRPRKMMTPYTQRCAELWLTQDEDENLEIQDALGANLAPLTARAHFIRRRLGLKMIEVHPKTSVWRLGQIWKVNKSQLRVYRNSVGGEEARKVILQILIEKTKLFVYQQDLRLFQENPHAFDALISAYTALLTHLERTEKPPRGWPSGEAWIEYPKLVHK